MAVGGVAAGDTFWLQDSQGVYVGHLVIASARIVDLPAGTLPTADDWSAPITMGVRTGLQAHSIECKGHFEDRAVWHWVDSSDYLIR